MDITLGRQCGNVNRVLRHLLLTGCASAHTGLSLPKSERTDALDDLRNRGMLSEEEFERAKTKALADSSTGEGQPA
jgi:hypothetical protein